MAGLTPQLCVVAYAVTLGSQLSIHNSVMRTVQRATLHIQLYAIHQRGLIMPPLLSLAMATAMMMKRAKSMLVINSGTCFNDTMLR